MRNGNVNETFGPSTFGGKVQKPVLVWTDTVDSICAAFQGLGWNRSVALVYAL